MCRGRQRACVVVTLGHATAWSRPLRRPASPRSHSTFHLGAMSPPGPVHSVLSRRIPNRRPGSSHSTSGKEEPACRWPRPCHRRGPTGRRRPTERMSRPPGDDPVRKPPDRYGIRVRGVLDRPWSAWFKGLEVTSDRAGQTTLAGPARRPSPGRSPTRRRCTACWPRCVTSACRCAQSAGSIRSSRARRAVMPRTSHTEPPAGSQAGAASAVRAAAPGRRGAGAPPGPGRGDRGRGRPGRPGRGGGDLGTAALFLGAGLIVFLAVTAAGVALATRRLPAARRDRTRRVAFAAGALAGVAAFVATALLPSATRGCRRPRWPGSGGGSCPAATGSPTSTARWTSQSAGNLNRYAADRNERTQR